MADFYLAELKLMPSYLPNSLSQHELSEDFNERMKLRVEMLSLKREEKINGIRSRAIDKLASRLQTTLRTFGGR